MCTVTFIKTSKGYCITSNRDESTIRLQALAPKEYQIQSKKIVFPKDPQAGGTWIAHDYSNCIVLLNGADQKLEIKPPYRKSRGLIVLELISSNSVIDYWKKIDLIEIEPFTIILFENNTLFQLQWNTVEKTTKELDITKNYIWSSSTLYSKEIRTIREEWFTEFLEKNAAISPDDIIQFHKFTQGENKEYGLQINRNNFLKTVSITQCVIDESTVIMKYMNLQ